MTNREIAQEISNRIGTAPVPFDSVYSIALQIYHELGGEEAQFDSVYSILLEILPLVEGGGSGKAIEIVDALPEASENKEKFYRLSSDDNVYVSELKSRTSTTTSRLPDAQQIDKAYLFYALEDTGIHYGEVAYYKSLCTIITPTAEYSGYLWYRISDGGATIYGIVSVDSAENVTANTNCYTFSNEDGDEFDLQNNIIYSDYFDGEFNMTISDEYIPIPATYNAPESAQIGNAYMELGEMWKYAGIETHLNIYGVETLTYKWYLIEDDTVTFYTTKKASEMYFQYINRETLYCDWHFYWEDGTEFFIGSNHVLDSIYIPQLNAPDSEQVGNAYITVNDNINCQYEGNTIDVHIDNDIVTMYVWEDSNQDYTFGTEVNASNVYGGRQFAFCRYDEDYQYWEGNYNLSVLGFTISSINTNKYQRTETTEEWGWQDIIPTYASDSDIDDLFDAPIVKRVLMKSPNDGYELSILEGLVNFTNDSTMSYNGQTYYKWVKYDENSNGESIPDMIGEDGEPQSEIIVLTTSLKPTLPFTVESPEFGYILTFNESTEYTSVMDNIYSKEALIHEDGSITYEE